MLRTEWLSGAFCQRRGSSWRRKGFQYGLVPPWVSCISYCLSPGFWWSVSNFWCSKHTLGCNSAPIGVGWGSTRIALSYSHCYYLGRSASLLCAHFCNSAQGFLFKMCRKKQWSKAEPCFCWTLALQGDSNSEWQSFRCCWALFLEIVGVRGPDHISQRTYHGWILWTSAIEVWIGHQSLLSLLMTLVIELPLVTKPPNHHLHSPEAIIGMEL